MEIQDIAALQQDGYTCCLKPSRHMSRQAGVLCQDELAKYPCTASILAHPSLTLPLGPDGTAAWGLVAVALPEQQKQRLHPQGCERHSLGPLWLSSTLGAEPCDWGCKPGSCDHRYSQQLQCQIHTQALAQTTCDCLRCFEASHGESAEVCLWAGMLAVCCLAWGWVGRGCQSPWCLGSPVSC